MDARKKIKNFILEEVCPEASPSCIEDETPLISSGLVDSLGILKILSFLDDEFGINIASDEIKHENFSTITTITGLVEKTASRVNGKNKMETRVKCLFATILKTDESLVCDSTTPSSLIGWDSIQHMFLVSGFEEEFNIDIDPEEVVEMYRDYSTFERVILTKMA